MKHVSAKRDEFQQSRVYTIFVAKNLSLDSASKFRSKRDLKLEENMGHCPFP